MQCQLRMKLKLQGENSFCTLKKKKTFIHQLKIVSLNCIDRCLYKVHFQAFIKVAVKLKVSIQSQWTRQKTNPLAVQSFSLDGSAVSYCFNHRWSSRKMWSRARASWGRSSLLAGYMLAQWAVPGSEKKMSISKSTAAKKKKKSYKNNYSPNKHSAGQASHCSALRLIAWLL